MSTVQDIINRVQTELEDATGEPGSDWTDADYILGKLATLSDDIAIRLELIDLNYNTNEMILPNIPANTIDLSAYQQYGQVLSQMLIPKSLEWRLVGENQQQWTPVQQVDKLVDTDMGTGEGQPAVATQTSSAVAATGSQTVDVLSVASMQVGQTVSVDEGANQESVVITALASSPASFTAVFTKLHASEVVVTASPTGVESDDPTVESYEWRGGILRISPSMTAVDLRIRFVSTVISLATNSQQQIVGLTNVYVYKCCEKITFSRTAGTNTLSQGFAAMYERACADYEGLSVKTQQSKMFRLGGRRSGSGCGSNGGWTPPIVG